MSKTTATSDSLPAELSSLRSKASEDFYVFAKGVCGFDWLTPRIHVDFCRKLQQNPRRFLAVLPRGWLKSTICSIAYPLWRATQNPNYRSLVTQNTYTNAVNKLKVIRGIVEHNSLFRALYPDLLPDSSCTWKDDSLCLKRSRDLDASTFEAAGTRTQVISRHYDTIIEDDTVAPELDDLSEAGVYARKEDVGRAIGWHRLVPPLLVNPTQSQNLVVGTRWFVADLISWIQENEKFVIYERAVLERDGKPDPEGKPVWPERFSLEVLEELRASLGPYLFSTLYMNSPLATDEMVFQPDWFKFYEITPAEMFVFTTVDVASDPETAKGDPDYNVVITCGQCPKTNRVYVLDYFRKKCSPGELVDAVFDHVRRWHPLKVGIESIAYQSTLQYWIRKRMQAEGEFFMIESITHGRRAKGARIMGLQPLVANGQLLFRSNQAALISEMTAFPFGKNDDLVDSLAMQLGFWRVAKAVYQKEEEDAGETVEALVEEIRKSKQQGDGYFDECLSDRLGILV